MVKPYYSNFRVITANFSGVQNFRIFTVVQFYQDTDLQKFMSMTCLLSE